MGPLQRIGNRTIAAVSAANTIATLLGLVVWSAACRQQWRATTRRVLLWQVYFTGVRTTPFILTLGGVIGVIIVMQAQVWLRQVGQSTLLAPLLVAVLIRELAPLLVNLLLIARSGNAMAVELGNMTVNDEVRSLRSQGVDPMSYLVVPRVLSLIIAAACLTLLFIAVSVGGGYLAGLVLGTRPGPPMQFADDLMRALSAIDVVALALKTLAPAAITGCICCAAGLSVTGGVNAVPPAAIKAMTRSVIATFAISVLISALSYL